MLPSRFGGASGLYDSTTDDVSAAELATCISVSGRGRLTSTSTQAGVIESGRMIGWIRFRLDRERGVNCGTSVGVDLVWGVNLIE